MSRRTRLVLALLALGGIAWCTPPTSWSKHRLATALGRGAGCPRPLPPIHGDSLTDLSPVQRCGIVWAALGALPDGPAARALRAGDTSAVRVLGLSESVTGPTWGRSSVSFAPARPWFEGTRMGSNWMVTVASREREVFVHEIWVDQRSGTARRVLHTPPPGALSDDEMALFELALCWVVGLGYVVAGMRRRRITAPARNWRPMTGTLLNQGPKGADPMAPIQAEVARRLNSWGFHELLSAWRTDAPREAPDRAGERWAVYHYRVGDEDFLGFAAKYRGPDHPRSTRLPQPPPNTDAGVPVTVYVDPADPALAMLEPITPAESGTSDIYYGISILVTTLLWMLGA